MSETGSSVERRAHERSEKLRLARERMARVRSAMAASKRSRFAGTNSAPTSPRIGLDSMRYKYPPTLSRKRSQTPKASKRKSKGPWMSSATPSTPSGTSITTSSSLDLESTSQMIIVGKEEEEFESSSEESDSSGMFPPMTRSQLLRKRSRDSVSAARAARRKASGASTAARSGRSHRRTRSRSQVYGSAALSHTPSAKREVRHKSRGRREADKSVPHTRKRSMTPAGTGRVTTKVIFESDSSSFSDDNDSGDLQMEVMEISSFHPLAKVRTAPAMPKPMRPKKSRSKKGGIKKKSTLVSVSRSAVDSSGKPAEVSREASASQESEWRPLPPPKRSHAIVEEKKEALGSPQLDVDVDADEEIMAPLFRCPTTAPAETPGKSPTVQELHGVDVSASEFRLVTQGVPIQHVVHWRSVRSMLQKKKPPPRIGSTAMAARRMPAPTPIKTAAAIRLAPFSALPTVEDSPLPLSATQSLPGEALMESRFGTSTSVGKSKTPPSSSSLRRPAYGTPALTSSPSAPLQSGDVSPVLPMVAGRRVIDGVPLDDKEWRMHKSGVSLERILVIRRCRQRKSRLGTRGSAEVPRSSRRPVAGSKTTAADVRERVSSYRRRSAQTERDSVTSLRAC